MSFNSLRVYWKSALCCKTHRAWSIPSEIRIFPVKFFFFNDTATTEIYTP